MNSKDLLAKLLANENLNIVRAPVSTASMDIKSRTLTLPQWKDMSSNVEEMLIGHEVGHALFTNEDYLKREEGDPAILHGYMNVIEDVRIEKKIKNKYPGLRVTFIQAYKELVERDFFELTGRDMSTLNLIDRINLYYKAGINCGVKFTAEEMEFVRAADRCDTIQDVYKLAKEILQYSRNVLKEKKQASLPNDITLSAEDIEDMEEVEFDDAYIDDEEANEESDEATEDEEADEEAEEEARGRGSKEQATPPTAEVTDEELESKTEAALRERLSNLADTNTIVRVVEPTLSTLYEPVVGYKTILGELSPEVGGYFESLATRYTPEWASNFKKTKYSELEKFKNDSARVVSYLVKEFEMKKSATSYKRATVAKTGELNVRKLHAYKLTQDLFKRVTVLPDAKNHGMVFLLDWSGSMQNVMHDTIKQVINLAMFCRRAQIPHQVFAFTNGYPAESEYHNPRSKIGPDYKGFISHYFNLFEFFSHKMTNVEFNKMVEIMFMEPYRYHRGYGLNSTPLNEGLLYMVKHLGDFKKANNIEKLSFITLTDGEGHGIHGYRNLGGYELGCKVVNYLRDPVTRREYPISSDGTEQTRTFLNVIKHRHDAAVIGFHVIRNSRRDMESFVRYNMSTSSSAELYSIVEDFKKQFRDKDFAIVPNAAHDDLYLLPASKTAISEGELKVDENMNSRQIAKQFEKFLDVKKTSRVLLNRFVAQIA